MLPTIRTDRCLGMARHALRENLVYNLCVPRLGHSALGHEIEVGDEYDGIRS